MLYGVFLESGNHFFVKSNAGKKIVQKYLYEYMVIGGILPDSEDMINLFKRTGYDFDYIPLNQVDIYNVIKNNDYIVIYLNRA